MKILKGKITKTTQGGKYASVTTIGQMNYQNVLMIYPYGFNSNIAVDETSLVLLFISGTNTFGIPYNTPLQNELLGKESEVGNFNEGGGKIKFNADGSIEITGNATSTGDLDLAGVLKVADTQVVSTQGAAVIDAAGGAVIDTEARVAINSLLARLRIHGLIA